MKQLVKCLEQVRRVQPLVHHITNYVTVNDCANITLAIGGSPIMADAIEEAPEIAGVSAALVLNMGTLNSRTLESMLAAGKAAGQKGVPVVFDPVGAGASGYRNEAAKALMQAVKPVVVRGNVSEILFLAGQTAKTKGVDASAQDLKDVMQVQALAKGLAGESHCVVAVTGKTDVITDGNSVICVENGTPKLSLLTGTGCMCTSLIGAFCGANPAMPLQATAAALLCMGVCGEIAWENTGEAGNGSFRAALHDAMSKLNRNTLLERGNVYET